MLYFWMIIIAVAGLGAAQLLASSSRPETALLVLNELVASNGAGLADEDGDFPDWIEIYNRSSQPVNLSGWALTDDTAEPGKWTFPDVTLPGHAYLVVFASGKNRKTVQPGLHLHTNFKLKKSSEFVGLYNILEGKFIDQIAPQYPPQLRDMAYGRYGEALTYGYLARPSPGEPNDDGQAWSGLTTPVEFSPGRGFYDRPLTVELTTKMPDAAIRYTLDGSEPDQTNGLPYTGPIPVDHTSLIRAAAFKPDHLPAASVTHSYIFLDDVMQQPADPPGWPAAWGAYNEFYPGLPPKGAPVPADYQMDPRIVNDPRFHDTFKDDLKSIPTMSIVTAEQNFDIYAHAVERGPAWERPVSVEFFDPNDPDRAFQINAGLRMQGVTARWEYMPKKSFRLFFKAQYGSTKLRFPLFPDSPVTEFDTLILRGGVNRSYAGYIDAVDYTQVTYTRDEWMRASQIAMSGLGSHGLFVHLYLNGLYWGLYNLVERPDISFTTAYLGGQEQDWFAIKHGATILNPDEVARGAEMEFKIGEEIGGSNERYEAMLELLDEGGLADPARYAAMKTYVDTAQFSDYIILNMYAGNRDWGDNNWYIGMKNPGGTLKYFEWDGEQVWFEGASLYLGKPTTHHKMRPLFLALMENPDFRMEFADRLVEHLFNDGALTEARAQARWLEINRPIEQAIAGESARWGDTRYPDDPIDRDDWIRARDGVLAQMAGNGDRLIALAREAGYYPPLDPPEFSHAGGRVTPGFELTMTAPQGVIYFTTDGSDPRVAGTGAITPAAQAYTGPLTLITTTHLMARALAGDLAPNTAPIWSALHEATFRVVDGSGQLQITEIMYNPAGGSDYEFIELKNTGDLALDLSTMTFSGISYTFPPYTEPLLPGQIIVLVSNAAAFAERYPDVLVNGVYDGQLANQGEEIRLLDAGGKVVMAAAYDDEAGWPVSPDGRGDSLVLADPAGDPNAPQSWRGSSQVNGSPGIDDRPGP
jgi:hypothetical protein